jgi:hypothetical protein
MQATNDARIEKERGSMAKISKTKKKGKERQVNDMYAKTIILKIFS